MSLDNAAAHLARTRMITEFTSLTGVDQRQVFDAMISDLRSTVLLDENKKPHNLEVIIALGLSIDGPYQEVLHELERLGTPAD